MKMFLPIPRFVRQALRLAGLGLTVFVVAAPVYVEKEVPALGREELTSKLVPVTGEMQRSVDLTVPFARNSAKLTATAREQLDELGCGPGRGKAQALGRGRLWPHRCLGKGRIQPATVGETRGRGGRVSGPRVFAGAEAVSPCGLRGGTPRGGHRRQLAAAPARRDRGLRPGTQERPGTQKHAGGPDRYGAPRHRGTFWRAAAPRHRERLARRQGPAGLPR